MADNQIPMGEGPVKKVRGSLIPDKQALGAHLKSGKIVAYAVLGAVVVGGIGFAAIDYFHGMGAAQGPAKETIHEAPVIGPKPRIEKSPANLSAPGARTTPGSAPTGSAASAGSGAPGPETPANTQPSPQVAAFEQAIGGQGGSGGDVWSWGGGRSAGSAVAATASIPETSPLQGAAPDELTLAKSIALMTKRDKEQGVYSRHLDRKEVSPYELLQGTVIPALLETGIKSDIAGQVTAVVDHPVYNSLNASYVLIPAGSRIVGYYRSGAAMGQTRVGVEWTRVEFPNGTYIRLSNMPGTSPSGYAGFKDLVDDHTWQIFKNALLLSFIDVGMAMASPTSTTTNTTGVTGNEALQNGEQALAQTFGQAEAQLFQKYINIAPTITIRPGYAFNVVVTRDLVFPGPYRHGTNLVGTAAPSAPAMPSEANPYGGGIE
ncbi:MAG: TraB/TrbI/VirB10 family type IV secretion system protein [Acidithiobacillus sp.]